jgi:hypothetical protein
MDPGTDSSSFPIPDDRVQKPSNHCILYKKSVVCRDVTQGNLVDGVPTSCWKMEAAYSSKNTDNDLPDFIFTKIISINTTVRTSNIVAEHEVLLKCVALKLAHLLQTL